MNRIVVVSIYNAFIYLALIVVAASANEDLGIILILFTTVLLSACSIPFVSEGGSGKPLAGTFSVFLWLIWVLCAGVAMSGSNYH
ncbi:MAG: hypothetical protein K6L76_03360 [Agarilytica sp.]